MKQKISDLKLNLKQKEDQESQIKNVLSKAKEINRIHEKKVGALFRRELSEDNLIKLKYIPVGLGSHEFSDNWLKDNTKINISKKNPYYGEYTFYYWFWKNILETSEDKTWFGFTGYRYHWSQKNNIHSDELNAMINKDNFYQFILKKIPSEWDETDVVLGQKMKVNNF